MFWEGWKHKSVRTESRFVHCRKEYSDVEYNHMTILLILDLDFTILPPKRCWCHAFFSCQLSESFREGKLWVHFL